VARSIVNASTSHSNNCSQLELLYNISAFPRTYGKKEILRLGLEPRLSESEPEVITLLIDDRCDFYNEQGRLRCDNFMIHSGFILLTTTLTENLGMQKRV
jgi:hypothetical protein